MDLEKIIPMNEPLDRDAVRDEIVRVAKSASGLESAMQLARLFGLQVAARQEAEARRIDEREAFAQSKGRDDFESWLAAKKASFVAAAAAAFDASHPPIDVPTRIEHAEVSALYRSGTFEPGDRVKLSRDLPKHKLVAGALGIVVARDDRGMLDVVIGDERHRLAAKAFDRAPEVASKKGRAA